MHHIDNESTGDDRMIESIFCVYLSRQAKTCQDVPKNAMPGHDAFRLFLLEPKKHTDFWWVVFLSFKKL